ncbi:MAG: anion permease, partial [Alphaproteobacteria bacterium]|nr:anion permease [Alphaproteobacteria bacterium]
GVTLLMQFFISLGFILPVNSPQSMVAYGTESFTIKDFMRVGIALTIVVYVLSFVFSLTYWKWLGIL